MASCKLALNQAPSSFYIEFPFPGFEVAPLSQLFPEHLGQDRGPFAIAGHLAPGNYGQAEEYDRRPNQAVSGIPQGESHEDNSDQQQVVEYAVGPSIIDRSPQFIDLSIYVIEAQAKAVLAASSMHKEPIGRGPSQYCLTWLMYP